MPQNERLEKNGIIFVSDYVPRQCGIATFAHMLCEAVAAEAGENYRCGVTAVNDIPEGYAYDGSVRFEIRESFQSDYRQAADFINFSEAAVVCLQHEYGIFGGHSGSHVLGLLRRLRRPVVTTLHTVLREPSREQRLVLTEVCRLSATVVVMSEVSRRMLREVYDVADERIVHIPHGIPDVPFIDPAFYKDKFDVEGRKLVLTFGLLGPGKGIEQVISALPAVAAKHPDVAYMVLGATHPHVRRQSGEEYRTGLHRLARDLGVEQNVIFQNRFVALEELCEFLGASDIYITPYLNEAQAVSGTLAYALGSGNACISTPYWYAMEMLADGRGILVPFNDPAAIAEKLLFLLDNEVERNAMRKRAYQFSRSMIWPEVGRRYMELFRHAQENAADAIVLAKPAVISSLPEELPEIDLRHLRLMTDGTGLLQHCEYATPDRRHGYCTDDNARALMVAAMYWHQTHDEQIMPLLHRYLGFVSHAFDYKSRRFRNFMDYDRSWAEEVGSEDAHARALHALGTTVGLCRQEPLVGLAKRLFEWARPVVDIFTSPRAWAYTILGIHAYLRRFSGDSDARRLWGTLAQRLYEHFANNMTDQWPWCEESLSYVNAVLPHALLASGKWLGRRDMIDAGRRALDWLIEIQTCPDGHFSFVGTEGWFPRGGTKARFDQQPIEAKTMITACVEANFVLGEMSYLEQARRCLNWFLGENDLGMPLYDFATGGCRDGLHPDRVNQNQGAESTLSWLLSLLVIQETQAQQALGEPAKLKAES